MEETEKEQGQTEKVHFLLPDGKRIETVLSLGDIQNLYPNQHIQLPHMYLSVAGQPKQNEAGIWEVPVDQQMSSGNI